MSVGFIFWGTCEGTLLSLASGRGDLFDQRPAELLISHGLRSRPGNINQLEEIDFHLSPDLTI